MFFFVGIKISHLPQITDSMEHAKLSPGNFVDICNYKSQVHDAVRFVIRLRGDVKTPRRS
jgi:hypothetical protein